MKKKLCCHCLTEPKTGYGNFKRCLTIAKELRSNKISTIFIIDKNQQISNELKKNRFKYIIIPETSKTHQDVFISKFMTKNKISTLILDVRQYGESLSKKLKTNNNKIILIDDVWSNRIYSDVFFNSTNAKTYNDYKIINNDAKIFLGTKYWIIDKNYKKYKKRSYKISKNSKLNLVISMGGSDPKNLTYLLLQNLKNRNDVNIKVIIGPVNRNFLKLKTLIKNADNISILRSPKNIFQIFSKADLVFSNGGNTLFELIALRIPTIAIPAFTHEKHYVKKFSTNNCIIKFSLKRKNTKNISEVINNFKCDQKLQKQLYDATRNIIDGNGLRRTVKIISKSIK